MLNNPAAAGDHGHGTGGATSPPTSAAGSLFNSYKEKFANDGNALKGNYKGLFHRY